MVSNVQPQLTSSCQQMAFKGYTILFLVVKFELIPLQKGASFQLGKHVKFTVQQYKGRG